MFYYFYLIWASLFQPQFYQKVITGSLSESVKYYAALSATLALVVTLAVGLYWAPQLNSIIRQFGQEVVTTFPEDLEVEIIDGQASTEVPGVYNWAWPSEVMTWPFEVDNILVVDTLNPPEEAIDRFQDHSTLILLTESSLVQLVDSERGDYQVQPLTDIPEDLTISRQELVSIYQSLSSGLNILPPMLAVLAFVLSIFGALFVMLYSVVLAVPVFFILKIFGLPGRYVEGFKVTLHAVTLGLMVSVVWLVIPGSLPPLGTLSILTLSSAMINLWYLRRYLSVEAPVE